MSPENEPWGLPKWSPKRPPGPPWRDEISPKNSSGGLLEVTNGFFRPLEASKSDFETS